MNVSEHPGVLERFRKAPRPFQRTFETPLKNLPNFVRTILSANEHVQGGCLIINQVVFEPKHLMALLAEHSLPAPCGHGSSVTVAGEQEVAALLEAGLSDWVDFLFVPTPETFSIYADHDEYTTFYAVEISNLDRIVDALSAEGFASVAEYERRP